MKKLMIALSLSIIASFGAAAIAQNPSQPAEQVCKKDCKEKKDCKDKKECKGDKKGKHGKRSKAECGKKGHMKKRGDKPQKFNRGDIFEGLNLTAEQKAKVENEIAKMRESGEKIRNKADSDGKKLRESFRSEMKKILSPDQFSKFEERMKNRNHHDKKARGNFESKRPQQGKAEPAPAAPSGK